MSNEADLINSNYQQTIAAGTDYWIGHAIDVIRSTYGDTVSVRAKDKDLIKFGKNENVGTSGYSTIMTLPSGILNETYVSSNIIDTVSSTDAGDTEEIVIEGHTIDGSGNFTFVVQTATLNGQNKVVLGTPLARMTRIYNNGTNDLVGIIYGYEDTAISGGAPTDGTKVHCMVTAGYNQSQKASTTISNQDYWLVTGFYADILEKASAFAEVELEIRLKGKVFRQNIEMGASSTGASLRHEFKPYLIVPANSDVRLRAIGSGANIAVAGGIQGVLAKVIS